MNESFNADIWPQPLSNEEILYYFEELKKGNIEARETIIYYNLRLVSFRVYIKFRDVPYDKDDLIDVGALGLMKAVDNFDYTRGFCFSSYAIKCIDNKIIGFINDYIKPAKTSETEGYRNIFDYAELDYNKNIEETIIEEEQSIIIRNLIDSLPERQREIIMMHFGFYDNQLYPFRHIGTQMGVSKARIEQLQKKALKQLKIKLIEFMPEKYNLDNENINIKEKTKKVKLNKI